MTIDLTPPAETPPLTTLVCQEYHEKGHLEPELLEFIHGELAKQPDVNALFWELTALEGLSRGLEQRGDAHGRRQILELLEKQVGRFPELERAVTSLMQDNAESTMARAKPFAVAVQKSAPQYGAEAPQGTKQLKDLMSERQLNLRTASANKATPKPVPRSLRKAGPARST